MRGCIVKDDHGYLLQPPKGIRVRLDNSDQVTQHVGSQVRVSGAFVDANDDTSPPSSKLPQGNGETPGHRVREFRVVKLDVLSQTCTPAGGKKR